MRDSMHRAGAMTMQRLLGMPESHGHRVPCACGQQAHFHENRRKQLKTMLGPVVCDRAYYLCPNCHQGQSPRDQELDVVGTECSPGVRRMMAAVGSETSFDNGRQQLLLLAGLEFTAKAVERHAEAIGTDIVGREQAKRDRVVQLEFPEILGTAVPVLYIEMDGTQLPMVRAELEGRAGRTPGQPARTREVKLGCVFTQTTTDPRVVLFEMQLPPPIPERSKLPNCSAVGSTPKPSNEVGIGPKRKWCWATAPNDLEHRRSAFCWRDPDRRYLACPRASLGYSCQAISLRRETA